MTDDAKMIDQTIIDHDKVLEPSQVDNLRRVLDAVLELHEQKPAKAEYREDANGNIIGLEMTYWCDECSHRGFKDYPCNTRKLIESEQGT